MQIHGTTKITMEDLLLPNTVNQKDEKRYTVGLEDTAIPHIKIKITENHLQKKSSMRQYRKYKPPCPPHKEQSDAV